MGRRRGDGHDNICFHIGSLNSLALSLDVLLMQPCRAGECFCNFSLRNLRHMRNGHPSIYLSLQLPRLPSPTSAEPGINANTDALALRRVPPPFRNEHAISGPQARYTSSFQSERLS